MSAMEITQNGMIERVALAVFKSTFHPDDAADEALVAEKRKEWAPDWRKAERAARAAIEAMQPEFMRCYDLGRDDANKAADVAFELIERAV